MANLLKSKFFLLRDFTLMKPSIDYHRSPRSVKSTLNEINETEVYRELNSLNPKNATGLSNLPPGLLKGATPVLAKPLTHVIYLSFRTGMFPTDWKVAKFVPVFKPGPSR